MNIKNDLNLEQGDYKLKDGVYLRKQKNNYRLIYPPRKDISKPFNLKNIHWKNFIGVNQWLNTLIIILVILSSIAYIHDTKECREIVRNPYKICGLPFAQANLDNLTIWGDITKEGDVVDEHNISLSP